MFGNSSASSEATIVIVVGCVRVCLRVRLRWWVRVQTMWGNHAESSCSGGSSPFHVHHLVAITARCIHLRTVDLTGCAIDGMLPGTSMPEMIALVRRNQQLESFRARAGAPAGGNFVHELAKIPALTSLSLARTDVQDETLEALTSMSDGRSCFPSLQRLSLAHCERLCGSSLPKLLRSVPTLRALSVDGCTHMNSACISDLSVRRSVFAVCYVVPTHRCVSCVITQICRLLCCGPAQKINVERRGEAISISAILHKEAVATNPNDPVPGALDVSCGVCGTVLWSDLRDYCLHDGQQAHIESELTTNTPPLPYANLCRTVSEALSS